MEIVGAETPGLEPIAVSDASGFETMFRAQYARIARVIAGVIRDPARAEELTVEVFLKFWKSTAARGERAEGWLRKAAVRKAIDELRRRERRARYEGLFHFGKRTPTPEELRGVTEGQERVRAVLAAIDKRQAELLLLRNQGLSYSELASALDLNPVSIGTLLARGQRTFRKEYIRRYGKD
ncbi:MAG TPA: sigma-70 family RNA polymerase sigma factor [Candidatus Acidoferrales bacterium]|nr:sigma-70 family RNA polymerase sigma factor [Candidatus Acidoferrales bacterium]